jgi:hypothetical protein
MRFQVSRISTRLMTAAVLATSASVLPGGTVAAQDGFLFKPPAVTLEFRVGRTLQSTQSDIYDQLTTTFTLDRGDFAATSYAGDAAIRASNQVDVVLGFAYAKSHVMSESRDFVGTDDLPIMQQTTLTRLPFTAGIRFFPMKRGETLGHYAWVPSRLTPYAGVGVGLMKYSLRQAGEFVDEEDLSIAADRLESKGSSPMAYGEAGVAVWLTQRMGLTGDARYTLAKSPMQGDFEQFNDIDLRGFQASAGLAVRF